MQLISKDDKDSRVVAMKVIEGIREWLTTKRLST